jgi:hypothetical protein
MGLDSKVELENAKNNKLIDITREEYKCKNCNYEGKLIHNAGVSDTLHFLLLIGLPVIIFSNPYDLMSTQAHEKIKDFWYITLPIIIFLGYEIAKNVVPYNGKCPSCGLKTKGMVGPQDITRDENFDLIKESNSIDQTLTKV